MALPQRRRASTKPYDNAAARRRPNACTAPRPARPHLDVSLCRQGYEMTQLKVVGRIMTGLYVPRHGHIVSLNQPYRPLVVGSTSTWPTRPNLKEAVYRQSRTTTRPYLDAAAPRCMHCTRPQTRGLGIRLCLVLRLQAHRLPACGHMLNTSGEVSTKARGLLLPLSRPLDLTPY